MPPSTDQEVIESPSDERRDAIEAAFAEAEKTSPVEGVIVDDPKVPPTGTVEAKPAAVSDTPTEGADKTGVVKPDGEAKPVTDGQPSTVEEGAKKEKPLNLEVAPVSWKGPQKEKWLKLDPDIRQEVLRRERETQNVMNLSAQARRSVAQIEQAAQPFMQNIQARGADIPTAIHELLKSDHILTNAPPKDKAAFMATLIQEYKIDIKELDEALHGQIQTQPMQEQIDRILAQRMAPFNSFMRQQSEFAQHQEEQGLQQVVQTIDSMAADTAKFPHFDRVREQMADIMEFNTNKNRNINLETAYSQAVAMDPELSAQATQRLLADQQQSTVAAINSKAQRAINASVSVGGAPSGGLGGTPSANDRRAVIEAAFDQAAGR